MKSNKVKETIGRLKERFMKFAFTDTALKKMEEEKQLSEANRKEMSITRKKRILVSLIIILCLGVTVVCLIKQFEMDKPNNNVSPNATSSGKVEIPDGERATIVAGDLTRYMTDSINNIYVKTAYTEIDGNVAYSVTYNNDTIPQGEVVYTHYLTTEKVTTILLNGYPYVSYEEMGLKNEEEAYMATQLAVYEMISRQGIEGISNGTFSLDKINASEEQYEDMVNRVIKKAKQLVQLAIEDTYEDDTSSSFVTDQVDIVDNGNVTLIGPFYTKTTIDDDLKTFHKNSPELLNYTTTFKVNSFYDESKAYTVDKDGNEISNVKTGEPFYVKIVGNEKYFSQLNVEVNAEVLYTRIYSAGDKQKRYAVLTPKDLVSKTVTAMYDNVEVADLKLNFKDGEGNEVYGIKYKLYNEAEKLLQDVDGYSKSNEFRLPLGKYYIEIYDVPKDYLLNQNRYEANLVSDDDSVSLDINIDSLDSFLKK